MSVSRCTENSLSSVVSKAYSKYRYNLGYKGVKKWHFKLRVRTNWLKSMIRKVYVRHAVQTNIERFCSLRHFLSRRRPMAISAIWLLGYFRDFFPILLFCTTFLSNVHATYRFVRAILSTYRIDTVRFIDLHKIYNTNNSQPFLSFINLHDLWIRHGGSVIENIPRFIAWD